MSGSGGGKPGNGRIFDGLPCNPVMELRTFWNKKVIKSEKKSLLECIKTKLKKMSKVHI